MPTVRWQPDRTVAVPPWPVPPLMTSMARGLADQCPACGQGLLFRGFLKLVPNCPHCGAPLGLARADDAPPYFVILITGHIVVPLMLVMQKFADPPNWELAAIFLPVTVGLALGLLRPVKGAVVGAMLSLGILKPEPLLQ